MPYGHALQTSVLSINSARTPRCVGKTVIRPALTRTWVVINASRSGPVSVLVPGVPSATLPLPACVFLALLAILALVSTTTAVSAILDGLGRQAHVGHRNPPFVVLTLVLEIKRAILMPRDHLRAVPGPPVAVVGLHDQSHLDGSLVPSRLLSAVPLPRRSIEWHSLMSPVHRKPVVSFEWPPGEALALPVHVGRSHKGQGSRIKRRRETPWRCVKGRAIKVWPLVTPRPSRKQRGSDPRVSRHGHVASAIHRGCHHKLIHTLPALGPQRRHLSAKLVLHHWSLWWRHPIVELCSTPFDEVQVAQLLYTLRGDTRHQERLGLSRNVYAAEPSVARERHGRHLHPRFLHVLRHMEDRQFVARLVGDEHRHREISDYTTFRLRVNRQQPRRSCKVRRVVAQNPSLPRVRNRENAHRAFRS
mmetsp:Transcript_22091/g.58466  ORF Transcript_22091/g.58466 Transcript_22091/m.58466 type:complete len:418 (+) Transcript_22091:138-1391(+)